MPVGPWARLLAQVIVPVAAILARALPAAFARAVQNARQNNLNDGVSAASNKATQLLRKTISRSEALQVLHLNEAEAEASVEAIQRQYDRYMAANDPKKGGSFYLQSKVHRAKQLLEEFHREKRAEHQQAQAQAQAQAQQTKMADAEDRSPPTP